MPRNDREERDSPSESEGSDAGWESFSDAVIDETNAARDSTSETEWESFSEEGPVTVEGGDDTGRAGEEVPSTSVENGGRYSSQDTRGNWETFSSQDSVENWETFSGSVASTVVVPLPTSSSPMDVFPERVAEDERDRRVARRITFASSPADANGPETDESSSSASWEDFNDLL
ncbi:hypothetical protein FOZ60_016911 [Perkinsus olseni]|uniref:Uncharacterized protein n=1 Tax=Perkinsus olseni TaxID=32597 RepID=A0A7J6N5D6_PEROL|nr:hypothetical protein FOZ60_016911 [Perkinsus olseni]